MMRAVAEMKSQSKCFKILDAEALWYSAEKCKQEHLVEDLPFSREVFILEHVR